MYKPRLLTIKGITKHIKEWALIYNIPFSIVESRWDKGVRDVLTLLSPRKEFIQLTYNEQTATLKQWASITGIKYDTLHSRYTKNKDPEKVLSPWCFNSHTIKN